MHASRLVFPAQGSIARGPYHVLPIQAIRSLQRQKEEYSPASDSPTLEKEQQAQAVHKQGEAVSSRTLVVLAKSKGKRLATSGDGLSCVPAPTVAAPIRRRLGSGGSHRLAGRLRGVPLQEAVPDLSFPALALASRGLWSLRSSDVGRSKASLSAGFGGGGGFKVTCTSRTRGFLGSNASCSTEKPRKRSLR